MRKTFTRICSMLLSLVMLLQMIPPEPVTAAVSAITEAVTQVTPVDAQPEEITENRTEYIKEYKMPDGLHMAVVYPDAVHYESDGRWLDIDNTLKATGIGTNAVYTNTAGVWDVQFPQSLSAGKPVTVTKDGYTLSFTMSGELRRSGDLVVASLDSAAAPMSVQQALTSTAQIETIDLSEMKAQAEYPQTISDKLQSRLRYNSVFTGTNLVYDLTSNTLKESIVMERYSSTLRGYRYTLDVGQLRPVLQESGEILLYDSKGENVVMTMPAPYLLDANMDHCEDVTVSLTGSGSTYTLSYYLPQDWLAASDRAWPVILDPVVQASTLKVNIQDVTVSEKKTYSHTWGMLECGHDKNYGISRFFVKFTSLPKLTSSDYIVHATIMLYNHHNGTVERSVEAHEVLAEWTDSGMNWSNKPDFDQNVADYARVKNAGNYIWDITDIAQKWYNEKNTGVMFKMPASDENVTTNTYKQFRSVNYGYNRPTLTIWFRNNNGLESYWDYTSVSAGRAGTGSIHNYTGNLVWTHADMGFGGNRMPVSISHIYNTNDAASNSFGLGNGWRTNLHQSAYVWSENSNYYVWDDEDGTKHYFLKQSNGTYKDEDGLELTLTVSGNNKIITDKQGNTRHFDSAGRLYKLENNQEVKSSINITYTSSTSKLISTVTDGVGRVYAFNYNDSDQLTSISYKGSGETVLYTVGYDYTGTNLTCVTYADGESSTFTYGTGNLLTAAEGIDGDKITLTYNGTGEEKASRVTGVAEFSGETAGGSLTFDYANNQTTLTDHNDNKKILQFNNCGMTTSVQDGLGRAQFMDYDDETPSRLTLASKLQSTVINLFQVSSFESGTAWTATDAEGVTAELSTEAAYYGAKALKLVRTGEGGYAGAASAGISVPANTTYTFSAYVKTGSGATAYLGIHDGTADVISSEKVAGNSDWTRLEVSYENTTAEAVPITCRLYTTTAGTVYMDCVQLEDAPTASRYNIIENGDFRWGAENWTLNTTASSDDKIITADTAATMHLDNSVYQLAGRYAELRIVQDVPISGGEGDTFVLAGWAKGDSVAITNDVRTFAMRGVFVNTDGTETKFTFKFNYDADSECNWQYVSGEMVADKPFDSIKIQGLYDYNMNTVLFDGIQLFKEEFGTSYTYDDDSNVTSVVDLQKKTTTYEYTDNNLTKEILPSGAEYTYDYDSWHNVTKATSAEGMVYEFVYDDWGNNTQVFITEADGKTISSTATYSEDGNLLVKTTDALGKETKYGYDPQTNVLHWVQYPGDTDGTEGTEDTRTKYTYDTMHRMLTATAVTDSMYDAVAGTENAPESLTASYTYTADKLTALASGSSTYNFTYGAFGSRTGISIGSRDLASYTYSDAFDQLVKLDYGNEDSVQYTYDSFGRQTGQSYEDGATVSYLYNNESVLASVTDSETGMTTRFYYDFLGRPVKYTETAENFKHSVLNTYNADNNLEALEESINGTKYTTSYAYDDDNRLVSVTNGNVTETYAYDAYGRLISQTTKQGETTVVTETYTYTDTGANATSAQIASLTTVAGGVTTVYTYTYDDNGNILSISDGTNTTSYVYDSANQLTRENNQAGGFTHTWTYDNAGNILSRSEYAYTTGALGTALDTVNYTYGDEDWGDLLTAYDGTAITTDEIGNMLTDGTWTYSWKHGRQLASMTNGTTTWDFTYNADGLRTKRTNGTTTYNYVYSGTTLTHLTVGNDVLHFSYGADGRPMTVTYNGTEYYYITNLQGDVVAIADSTGAEVVNYSYDAWGKLLSTTGSLASTLGTINPLRYRGYVYDQETGLYYLQSRYYNPEICRFINADVYAKTGQGLLSNNTFVYCLNNPVTFSDHSGMIPFADDPFSEVYQQIGTWLSPYVGTFFSKFVNALAGSYSISGELGSGFGVSGKIGILSVDASAVIVADEWTLNADGTTEEIRKGSITVQGELIEDVGLGVDVKYYVPLKSGKKYGLLGAPGGKFDATVGAYAFNQVIGLKTTPSQDVELSFGLSGYFILGGGFEFSVNLNEFIRIWCED